MRGLAEFIMRGRWQALAVAVLGSVLVIAAPMSAAAIALVTMAQGMRNGTWVALWALLPALLLGWVSGDYGTGFLLLSVYVGAVVLAQTLSLSLALIAIIPVSAVGGFVLLTFNTAFLEAMLSMLDAWIAALQSESPETGDSLSALRPTANQVAGLMATGNAFLASLSLLLGRYWQSALFKPGAFGEEFRALKLPGALTALLVLVAMAGALSGSETAAWSALAGIPVTLAGFGLFHHIAKRQQLGGTFLTIGYVLWVIVDGLKVGVLLAVLLDAFLDLGRRVKPK
ncbi:hypothetical protein E0F26_04505 [Candidatus Paraluminiphilus aquimaris]|uniref:DUF2232 domain-containing protein n=1 Tax=Candidatus Paraluminiphilus aquimaris TaxID=2518994 RepID=A0ABY6Q583_9GAMM|nr:hypothetical protein [Candidatus Paraluminiphilus aquimaris]UZP74046.1 hypothetical protein E0F26_04505 [Candidatus Paraluminiphilus aquimaris]